MRLMTQQPQSAIKSVRRSGLELIPQIKRRGKLATAKNLAKLDWKPWKRDPDALSGKMMHELGVSARLAYATFQSRAKLIEIHKRMNHEDVDELMANLAQACEKFKAIASIIDQAYVRILAAGERHALSGGKFKFRDGSSRSANPSEI
jgi:hypothetical protein